MYHFTHFNIHNFRGFRNFSFDNLGLVNLLVGMNNSGKTSLLESLSLYCRSPDLAEWVATASRRRIRQPLPLIESLKWFFSSTISDGGWERRNTDGSARAFSGTRSTGNV